MVRWASQKKKLQSTEPDYLRKFILETRRGEFSHWVQWILITSFIAWNPFPANLIIIAYAFASNVPCLVNLRHTRQRLLPAPHKTVIIGDSSKVHFHSDRFAMS